MENTFKVVEYSKIGEVKYLKKKGVRRVSISVKPFKGVVVTMPFSFSYSDAERFVMQKTEWIAMARLKMGKIENRKTIFEEGTVFRTKKRTLVFERKILKDNEAAARISKEHIIVSLPPDADILSDSIQELIMAAIEKAWTAEAKELLPIRVSQLASANGFTFSGVVTKRIKSRWGSCSTTNNINLSVYLLQLPDILIDYVILHELCHTVHKNHGPKFWALLDKLTNGTAKQMAREMKRYSTRYF